MTAICNTLLIKNEERSIDDFLSKGKIIYPYYESDRASIAQGCSEECPYNTFDMILTFVRPRPATERMLRKGYAYCWESCTITDCPTYQKEHRDKD